MVRVWSITLTSQDFHVRFAWQQQISLLFVERPAASTICKRPASAISGPDAIKEVPEAEVAQGEEVDKSFGCSKCRYAKHGHPGCREWADNGLEGFSVGPMEMSGDMFKG